MARRPVTHSTFQYYSHDDHRQDRWLVEDVFRGKRDGYFLDIGAGPDGITNSNSYALESQLGWSGICVEAHPERFEKVRANRCCEVEHVAISDAPGTVEFTLNLDLPGTSAVLSELSEPSRRDDYEGGQRTQMISMRAVPLADLLDQHGAPNVIDYMSLDIEGSEWVALKDFPFDRYTFLTMTIERNAGRYLDLQKLLLAKGYRIAHNYCVDDFWYHPSLDYRPRPLEQLATTARRAWRQFYDRAPGLALRRVGRALRGGKRRD